MRKPNVVVVGYGFAGRCFHTYLVNLVENLNLYGVVSSRNEAQKDVRSRFGAKSFNHFKDVLADDLVDLIVLATPNRLHAPHAIQALQAGKHVITDKPMCLNLEEADLMIEASKSNNRLLSVFQNRRWDGDFLTVKHAISSDYLGSPYLFELFWGQYGTPRGWRGQADQGGGKFFDLGTHLVDQVLQLVNAKVTKVHAVFHSPDDWPADVEAHATANILFSNGVEARVETSSLAIVPKSRWRIFGTKGIFVKDGVDPQEQAMIAGDIDSAKEATMNRARVHRKSSEQDNEIILETIPGRWRSYYENIAIALTDREKLLVTPQSVRETIAVIEAARRSAATNQIIELA